MQSRIKSDFKIKTIRATWADMKQFKKFVEKLEVECSAECAVKIVPPKEFKKYTKKLKSNTVLSNVVVQRADEIKANKNVAYELYYDEKRKMSYNQFLKSVQKNEQPNKTIDEYKNLTWKKLQKGTEKSLYAVDNPQSLFSDSCEFMNLNRFSQAESLIHQDDVQIEGIQTPYLYVGHAKVWYFVPASENAKLEKLAKEFGMAVGTTCNNFIKHKSLMIPPATLRKNNIRFSRIVQNSNEFIISFSGGYHSGFNCGINKAEAINFATRGWLNFFPKFLTCCCSGEFIKGMKDVGKTLTSIFKHEKSKLEKKEAFTCAECSKTFTLKDSIRRQ